MSSLPLKIFKISEKPSMKLFAPLALPIQQLSSVLVAMMVMVSSSCSTNRATEWRDSNIYQGDGGAVETIDGMDVWVKGTPDRKFKVIAFIDHSHRTGGLNGLINSMSWKTGAVKKAKKLGGEAIIISTRYRELRGFSTTGNAQITGTRSSASVTGTANSRASYSDKSEILVIDYLD